MLLYNFYIVDEFNTPVDKISEHISGIVAEEASWMGWTDTSWTMGMFPEKRENGDLAYRVDVYGEEG